jgi:hypothetical protein
MWAATLVANGRGDCGTLPVGMLNSNNGPSLCCGIARRSPVRRGREAILLLIPSTEAEGCAIKDYPASSVNREMIHQMNRKHATKVDACTVTDHNRPRAAPSVGSETPREPNHACRDRQS